MNILAYDVTWEASAHLEKFKITKRGRLVLNDKLDRDR